MGVRLTWVDENPGETGHRVYRSTAPMDPENLPEPLVELGPDVEAWEDGSALPDTTYYYRVSAVANGAEAVSEEAEITTGSAP